VLCTAVYPTIGREGALAGTANWWCRVEPGYDAERAMPTSREIVAMF
jgi:hypothetical protein